jgi:hypothetical protein
MMPHAGAVVAAAPVTAVLPSVPKMILSKVFLSVLLSKFVISIGFCIVTWDPLATDALVTAAQISPSFVFSRK